MLLGYVFATFVVGIACLGALLVLVRRRDAEPARAFLAFYAALTVLVFGRLLLAFVGTLPDPSDAARAVLEYMEAFVGRYGVMFALPYFAHRAFGVRSRRRDAILLAVVLAAVAGQHLTEFVLGGVWDDRGDVAEDVLFAGVVAYTLWIGLAGRDDRRAYRPLAGRFLVLLLLALPGIAYDLFLSDGTAWRVYPLWYCALSVVLTATLVGRRFAAGRSIPPDWGLSAREEEVARLVREGLSNREIARRLTISTNTVKTHVRAIFDKSGFRSRVGVIAALAGGPARGAAE